MKEITSFVKPYNTTSIKQEIDRIRTLALAEIDKKKSLSPLAFIFFKDEQTVIPLKQFDTQQEAQYAVANFATEKQALFFIVVGMTSQQNALASQFTDYFLNLIGHQDGKVVWQKSTLFYSAGVFSVIETTENFSALESSATDEAFKQIIDAEKGDFEVEGEDIGDGFLLVD